MEFKISKGHQLIIDAWRTAADILNNCDMEDFTDIHKNNNELLLTIDLIADEMRKIADDIEQEQKSFLISLKDTYKKKFSPPKDK